MSTSWIGGVKFPMDKVKDDAPATAARIGALMGHEVVATPSVYMVWAAQELQADGESACEPRANEMDYNSSDDLEESVEEGARRFAEKIHVADKEGAVASTLSTTESIMVALALCDRGYLPSGFGHTRGRALWLMLDHKQRAAITIWMRGGGAF